MGRQAPGAVGPRSVCGSGARANRSRRWTRPASRHSAISAISQRVVAAKRRRSSNSPVDKVASGIAPMVAAENQVISRPMCCAATLRCSHDSDWMP
ncbi:hypothetical protein [Lysobacter sp. 1R34A]|uniref:hypothetical protein n=1 Tax=Lysobacter sp. 1R34A TaxID=3445786 RepID=UPI003EE92F0E